MKISVIASTHENYVAPKSEFDNLSGHAGGVCYMPDTFKALMNEKKETTEKRVNKTKSIEDSVRLDIIKFIYEKGIEIISENYKARKSQIFSDLDIKEYKI